MRHTSSLPTSSHRSARRAAPALLLSFVLASATPAAASQPTVGADASVVTTWNQIAVSTLTQAAPNGAGLAPPVAFLYLAFVHTAMYNAVAGITREYELYEWDVLGPKSAWPEPAAAAAAHRVLRNYFGGIGTVGATLDAQLAASLSQIPPSVPKQRGINYGVMAADHIIALRANDGRNAPVTVPPATEPGDWVPTPPLMLPFAAPWFGGITPMVVDSTTQFPPGPPPAINSATYLAEFNEVRDYGIAGETSLRTAEQTLIARFFAEIPLGPMQAGIRDHATRHGLDIGASARLFAAVETSITDALATVWYAKLQYMWWRPITAIQNADTDGNPATASVPGWMPLIANPPYPEWPSGLCAVVGSVTTALTRVSGMVDLNLTGPTQGHRYYADKATLDQQAIDARVWSGIHFRTADVVSIGIGTQVANFTLDHHFQPTD